MPATTPLTIGAASIREKGGLYCLCDVHRASGWSHEHHPKQWLRLLQTKELIASLQAEVAASIAAARPDAPVPASELEKISKAHPVMVTRGATGAWVCPELAIAYAAWISPAFHMKVLRTLMGVFITQGLT